MKEGFHTEDENVPPKLFQKSTRFNIESHPTGQ
jgi:hypothetical protein